MLRLYRLATCFSAALPVSAGTFVASAFVMVDHFFLKRASLKRRKGSRPSEVYSATMEATEAEVSEEENQTVWMKWLNTSASISSSGQAGLRHLPCRLWI